MTADVVPFRSCRVRWCDEHVNEDFDVDGEWLFCHSRLLVQLEVGLQVRIEQAHDSDRPELVLLGGGQMIELPATRDTVRELVAAFGGAAEVADLL